jgi:hypothetical protein
VVATDGSQLVAAFSLGAAGATFGEVQLGNLGGTDIAMISLTSGGALRWARVLGGSASDAPGGIALRGTDVLLGGRTRSPMLTFGETSIVPAGELDGFVVAFDVSSLAP